MSRILRTSNPIFGGGGCGVKKYRSVLFEFVFICCQVNHNGSLVYFEVDQLANSKDTDDKYRKTFLNKVKIKSTLCQVDIVVNVNWLLCGCSCYCKMTCYADCKSQCHLLICTLVICILFNFFSNSLRATAVSCQVFTIAMKETDSTVIIPISLCRDQVVLSPLFRLYSLHYTPPIIISFGKLVVFVWQCQTASVNFNNITTSIWMENKTSICQLLQVFRQYQLERCY